MKPQNSFLILIKVMSVISETNDFDAVTYGCPNLKIVKATAIETVFFVLPRSFDHQHSIN
jgi:hypothetical protein